ncbi:MAG: Stp1/IreP family PP2C-type Ser/Thr phosphatase [Gammaproteobacteria bacterium]|nr:Stp1/IreP family PP2C-type Ser/Thr phosphatase [Gammaproteobacteria bacterium]
MNLRDKIIITGLTDQGLVRDHNEDSIGQCTELGLAVLADGMGGHKGGEVASALAVDTILSELKKSLPEIKTGQTDKITGYSLESMAIEAAIKKANLVIFQASQNNKQYEGMGTTVVVLLFYDNRLTVAHVGDSRLYRMREETLEQMTRDHTLLQELVDRGLYTKEEAQQSLNKNLVTRAVGVNAEVDIDLLEDFANPMDIFLMCSDGLNDMIDDQLIEYTILNYRQDLKKVARELVKQAKDHGGKDNVSALLAMPVKTFSAKNGWISRIFDLFSIIK